MKKLFYITGEPNSGKTYYAITEGRKKGSVLCLFPCRTLVGQTAMDYQNQGDGVVTGNCHLYKGSSQNDTFAVFEAGINLVKNHDVIVIDECHFLTDHDRGEKLSHVIKKSIDMGKTIYLVTATPTFTVGEDWEHIHLPSRGHFEKTRITDDESWDRVVKGVPTLIHAASFNSCDEYAKKADYANIKFAVITGKSTLVEVMETCSDFNAGEFTCFIGTNVLAQGLNLCAENVIIEENRWDSDDLIAQKLGRLGRSGITKEDTILTYSVAKEPPSILNIKSLLSRLESNEYGNSLEVVSKSIGFCEIKKEHFISILNLNWGEKDRSNSMFIWTNYDSAPLNSDFCKFVSVGDEVRHSTNKYFFPPDMKYHWKKVENIMNFIKKHPSKFLEAIGQAEDYSPIDLDQIVMDLQYSIQHYINQDKEAVLFFEDLQKKTFLKKAS